MAGSDYVVTAPVVVAKNKDGADEYLYQHQTVRDSIPDDVVQRLAAAGFISRGAEQASTSAETSTPTKSSKVEEWRAYAIAQGQDPAEVAKTTKKDLVAFYLGDESTPAGTDPKGPDPEPGEDDDA